MPLFNDDGPEPEAPEVSAPATIHSPEYRSSLVESTEVKPESLLVHIEGYRWNVLYYSQYLGADEEIAHHQPTQLPIYQQYLKINQMELRVDSPLSDQQDSESNEVTTTGSAVVYPFLIPNVGDTFIAEVADGRQAVLTVTNVERMSIFKQAVHQIDYQVVNFLTEEAMTELDKRVVKEVWFHRDLMANGQYPILVDSEGKLKERLEGYIPNFLRRFYMEFFSREFSTFLVPGQAEPTYDHYLTKFMLQLFDPHTHRIMREVRELTVDGQRLMDQYNLWNVLMTMDRGMGDYIQQKLWAVDVNVFSRNPRFEGIRFSGIQKVVYPFEQPPTADNDTGSDVSAVNYEMLDDMDWDLISVLQVIEPGNLDYPEGVTPPPPPPAPVEPPEIDTPPLIHPVLIDDFYVFSENFYTQSQNNQSVLELIVNQVIDNEGVDYNALFQVAQDVNDWGRLERFYYLPVLMAVMRVLLRRL